jgi:hypothetical protein
MQPRCDLLVGQPAGDEAQHVRLPGGDSRGAGHGASSRRGQFIIEQGLFWRTSSY